MTATLEPTMSAKAAKAGTAPTPADVIRKAKEAGVQMVDVRFTDLPGTWQHFSLPLKELTEAVFAEGVGFDGSSIRGFQAIDRKSTRLNSSHSQISYAVFCLKKKNVSQALRASAAAQINPVHPPYSR